MRQPVRRGVALRLNKDHLHRNLYSFTSWLRQGERKVEKMGSAVHYKNHRCNTSSTVRNPSLLLHKKEKRKFVTYADTNFLSCLENW